MRTFLLLSFCFFGTGAQDNSRSCWASSRWWPEGSEITRGRYFYKCNNGKLEPKGCLTEFDRRIDLWAKYKQGTYEMQCIQDTDLRLTFKMTACLPAQGGRYTEGQQWNEFFNKYWYKCEKLDEKRLMISIGGCVLDTGGRIDAGAQHVNGDYWWECKKPTPQSPMSMCPAGCVVNGVKQRFGYNWQDTEFSWRCETYGIAADGCLFNGRRLYEYEKYENGDVFYQCVAEKDNPRHEPVGCVHGDRFGGTFEKCIGCEWEQEDSYGKFKVKCVEDRDTLKIEPNECIFDKNGRHFLSVAADHYTMFFDAKTNDNLVFACKKSGSVLQKDQFTMDQLSSRGYGLQYQSPSG